MKHIFVFFAALLISLCATAQSRLIKDAELALKKGEPYASVVKILTPAFENPLTSDQAQTYFIPGKAGMATYQRMLRLAQAGQLPKDGAKTRSEALLGGYRYLNKAMSLDSVYDAKGKVKTKYSKDAVSLIAKNYPAFREIGIDFWNAKRYDDAYEAWDIYCRLPYDPRYAKKISAPADSVIARVMYNRSLAAYHSGDMAKALASFIEAMEKGYKDKNLFDYAIYAAEKVGDRDELITLCLDAMPLYGHEDDRYVRQLINQYMAEKDYDSALDMIGEALANDPDNAQYHVIRGVLYVQADDEADARAEFERALELDQQNSEALFNIGRLAYNHAVALNDAAPSLPQDYARVKADSIVPAFKEAIGYLERAWETNPNNTDALMLLQQAYYNVDDADGLQYTRQRLGDTAQ